ncbi:hypothetical protein FB45DRAFT_1065037 [Roridomyces roridus]|uniref:Transmembrane protein n=1 Tax=Roridomyces roridus TaxID=1738132 RepID=A0AAD7FE63_9AGAR|nr:hypothetical protein FB45DRAFT_1065037 [Roridomyces roridus]
MDRSRAQEETQDGSVTVITQDESGPKETLLGNPAGSSPLLQSPPCRGILLLSLHVALVAIQLVLLFVWHQGWEHRIVFSVNHELRVAQLVKGILTTFITLYSALLVFLMQSLALRRDLHKNQLLTATHDNAVAWSSLGSAIVRLWQQRALPASTVGVLCALTYLAGISVLHTAFPGVAAPQSLFVNQSMPISTQSLPVFDLSGVYQNNSQNFLNAAEQYAGGSLSFLPFLTPRNTLGLHGATLYDVLAPNAGTGPVRVNATGFNISCGYIPATAFNATAQSINVGGLDYFLEMSDENVIATVPLSMNATSALTFPSPAVFYTSIPVLDSSNNAAPWINLTRTCLQVFRCSLTLVEQTVLVDAQSRNLTSFAFEMPKEKETSTWVPFSGRLNNLSSAGFANGARGFLDIWEAWYTSMPETQAPFTMNSISMSTVADIVLLQQLGLYPFNNTLRNAVYLHEVENQLAKIVASMFWTLGHVPPPSAYTPSGNAKPFNVSLLAGQAVVSQAVIEDRLDVNIISILECLGASLVLLGLSFRFSRMERRDARVMKINTLDVLQTIWLYRHHPKLIASLEQVQYPTDLAVRRSGMLRVRLIDGAVRMHMREDSGDILECSDPLSGTVYSTKITCRETAEVDGPSTWTSDLFLSLASTLLHSALVVIHLLLATLCGMKLEHRITFPLAQQSFVAWLASSVATLFITIYTAGLVFLTQTLSIKCSLTKTQMLTVTHDTVAAWQGFGSALSSIVCQAPSLSAVVPVFVYLLGILILHITSPALLVVQVFNTTLPVPVTTQGIPKFVFSGYELSNVEALTDVSHSPLLYGQGTFLYLPFVEFSSSPVLGLQGGMLYDVLNNSDSGTGTATVNAVRLNMSCGYFEDLVINSTGTTTILGTKYDLSARDIALGTISMLHSHSADPLPIPLSSGLGVTFPSPGPFCSTVPISDSTGNTGPLVNISAALDGAPDVQIFGCSLSLVNGSVAVDSQSRLLSDEWASRKDSSVWSPFQGAGNKAASRDPYDALVNDWASWYSVMPDIPTTYGSGLDFQKMWPKCSSSNDSTSASTPPRRPSPYISSRMLWLSSWLRCIGAWVIYLRFRASLRLAWSPMALRRLRSLCWKEMPCSSRIRLQQGWMLI